MKDRAQQALHLLALDPVVGTTADNNSYGFRQQRSGAEAIGQCHLALRSANTQWIPEGDIKSCFDKISPRLAFGSRPDGSSHSPKVAEIRVHRAGNRGAAKHGNAGLLLPRATETRVHSRFNGEITIPSLLC
jgi:hypothetical protein